MTPIISLTSIPPRFSGLDLVLGSLVTQGDFRVILWIPNSYRRFPDWDGDLPVVPEGVSVRRCEQDLGPATKLIPSLLEFPENPILICDDDAIYGPGWAEGFAEIAGRFPNCAIAASFFPVRRLGLPEASPNTLVCQGFAGVWVERDMLSGIDPGLGDIWVDDVWLSAQLASAGTAIIQAPHLRSLVTTRTSPAPLQGQVLDGLSRAEANRRCVKQHRSAFLEGAPAPKF